MAQDKSWEWAKPACSLPLHKPLQDHRYPEMEPLPSAAPTTARRNFIGKKKKKEKTYEKGYGFICEFS